MAASSSVFVFPDIAINGRFMMATERRCRFVIIVVWLALELIALVAFINAKCRSV